MLTIVRSIGCVAAFLTLGIVTLGLLGCQQSSGPQRFKLSGKVTFKGKPLPKGTIIFQPDAAAGNSGPGSSAEVLNGQYETLATMGTIGGPHVANITGYDGVPFQDGPQMNPMGHPLFMSYQAKVDLPKQDATHDFDVK